MENVSKETLQSIQKSFAFQRRLANDVMKGDNEYDGADGARTILDLCADFYKLFPETKEFEKEYDEY